ncbi:YwhD family protein [Sporosarcina sp. resist]|uniref:YwhD family protein n=1 Tax=Sporosarcina sp. resist TaxID=2762563 RepID=UPI00164D4558|nr:YwhD family protein [Sporosarcina sp. resist]QNK90452.1 YwhD family protein [Sporosarcina sp. resist]
MSFTILSGDSTDGDGGFGIGTISLDNVTPVIIDPEENDIFIDMDALHAKSKIEKKVRFKPDKEHAGLNPKRYWIVWLTLQNSGSGPYYSGATACEVLVSREERRIKLGYKSLPEHVNHMDKSLKSQIILSHMDEQSLSILRVYLKEYDAGYWQRSTEELKGQLQLRK